jgi:hypothetical protein
MHTFVCKRGQTAVIMLDILGATVTISLSGTDQAPAISAALALISLKTKIFPDQRRDYQLLKTTAVN